MLDSRDFLRIIRGLIDAVDMLCDQHPQCRAKLHQLQALIRSKLASYEEAETDDYCDQRGPGPR